MPINNINTQRKILYVVNFYGTPPLNFFSKYIRETTSYNLSIMKLPSVSLSKDGIKYESFFIDESGGKEYVKINIPTYLPNFVAFFLQYFFNVYSAIKLMNRKGVFDVAIGETSFGSFVVRAYKLFGLVNKTVFMNGDVLPIFNRKIEPYYLNSPSWIIRFIDRAFVFLQLVLRRIGAKNDIVWYANEQIREWDLENGIISDNWFVLPAVVIDEKESRKNSVRNERKNTLAYIGRLDSNAGVDIILESLPIIRKRIPNIKAIFVGGNPVAVEKYIKISKEKNVEDCVDFRGFVENTEDAINIISSAKLGIALYKPDIKNVSMYADVSKPKEYLRAGLPVIMPLGGPSVGYELSKVGACILVDYDPVSLANTCVDVLLNEKRYDDLLIGVRVAAKKYDYRKNFLHVMDKINSLI